MLPCLSGVVMHSGWLIRGVQLYSIKTPTLPARPKLPLSIRIDHDFIDDPGDAGRRPCHAISFLTFGPRANRTLKNYVAAIRVHCDSTSINLGIAPERLFYPSLYVRRLNLEFDHYDVEGTANALDAAYSVFCRAPLILPFDGSCQG